MMAMAACCIAVGLLETFDLHPQFSVGNFHSIWVGVREMNLESGTMVIPLQKEKKEIQRDYDLGPVKVAIISQS